MTSSDKSREEASAQAASAVSTSKPRIEESVSSHPTANETIVSILSQNTSKENEKTLPKTGSQQSVAGILLGVVSLVSSLVFLGKKKESND
nr:LPXTG cell wall anchor domain-containing protein [Streptococcus marmotae]